MSHSAIVLLAATGLAFLAPCGILRAAAVRFLPLNEEVAAIKLGIRDSKGLTNLKNLSSQKRSIPYTCTVGKKPLQLVAQDSKGADGKPAAVDVVFPAEMKSPLILILPDPQHPTGLRTLAVDDSSTGFPWGTLKFFNTTGSALKIRYGTEEKTLTEGDTLVDLTPGGEARNVGVQFFKEQEPKEILYSAVWEYDPNVRKLVFIVPGVDSQTRAFELMIIPEDKQVKK